ncbi:MAG: GPR endopeptidase [Ruminococcaceae bacterium]|nr:GPR endopeptidase [Oscillospiraceae bacterium]
MKIMKEIDFFDLKTDLADESDEILRTKTSDISGVESKRETVDGVNIFTMTVKNAEGEKQIGKKAGRYITLDVGSTEIYDTQTFENICTVFSTVISSFLDKFKDKDGGFLIAGLGNPDICADSVGKESVSSLIVTRHIKEASPELFEKFGFSETAAITPDVFGKTGVEAAEIIKGVADDIKPSCVIAIDALSSRRLSKLATTVQICDTGICPGSGVGNVRKEISEETIGVPVISIGVPTVVNASTLISDVLIGTGCCKENLKEKITEIAGTDCFVSKKECGAQIKSIGRLIGYSLNKAIHKDIDYSEMRDFL